MFSPSQMAHHLFQQYFFLPACPTKLILSIKIVFPFLRFNTILFTESATCFIFAVISNPSRISIHRSSMITIGFNHFLSKTSHFDNNIYHRYTVRRISFYAVNKVLWSKNRIARILTRINKPLFFYI